MDIPAEENHVFDLVKTISSAYLKIRLHHLVKERSLRINSEPYPMADPGYQDLVLFENSFQK